MLSMEKIEAMRRIKEEYRDLNRHPNFDLGITVGLPNEEDIFNWNAFILGSRTTLYRGGLFTILIHFPDDYPNHPPEIRFKTPIYHLNVNPSIGNKPLGFVSLSIINNWKPEYKIRDVLISVCSLFYMVNPECPYGLNTLNEYINNKNLYEEKIKYFTKKYAAPYRFDREYNDGWDFSYNP